MILVIDVGTTSIRVATMNSDGEIVDFHQEQQPPATPFPGLVEFDPLALSRAVIDLATAAIRTAGDIAGVAITTQRASTVVWNRSTGEPVGPGLGWQDLRTVGECMTAKSEHGVAVAPNQSATKAQWLLNSVENARERDLCIGTIDSWIDCVELEKGVACGMRSFYPDRVKLIPKKRGKRVKRFSQTP